MYCVNHQLMLLGVEWSCLWCFAVDAETAPKEAGMGKYEYKVNGETFFSNERKVDASVLLREAFAGKASNSTIGSKTAVVPEKR